MYICLILFGPSVSGLNFHGYILSMVTMHMATEECYTISEFDERKAVYVAHGAYRVVYEVLLRKFMTFSFW